MTLTANAARELATETSDSVNATGDGPRPWAPRPAAAIMVRPRLRLAGPALLVASITGADLSDLRASLAPVAYLNDSAMHEQMVRAASHLLASGRDPLGSWYPYLNLGSPQYLHYQSGGALATAALGLIVGPNTAFRWSLWLLLASWPIVIYWSGRILTMSRWAAATAAVASVFVASVPSIGIEHGAYLWIGYGLWAQLWGTWFLPLAWATTWRACSDRHFILPAGAAVAATIATHYETGYLALVAVAIFPLLSTANFRRRVARSAAVGVTAGLMSAWVLVPLLANARWAAVNQALQRSPLANGYGARRVLGWLFDGGVFDGGQRPALTIVALAGLGIALLHWKKWPAGRPLLCMSAIGLLLCFGRTTFGTLADAVPGSNDIFFRRFMMGAQVAGVLACGLVVPALYASLLEAGRRLTKWPARGAPLLPVHPGSIRRAACALSVLAVAIVLVPAANRTRALDERNAAAIAAQRRDERQPAALVDALLSYVRSHVTGRVYAGSPDNWGAQLTVGHVPVFEYLASQDIDEVGFTLRTASLMSQPEYRFDERNPSDYALFGIRYLLLPTAMKPPVPATSTLIAGPYRLWTIPANSYFSVTDVVGVLWANRRNVGTRAAGYLDSRLFAHHQELAVSWPGRAQRVPPSAAASTSPGTVLDEAADLDLGRASADVRMARPGTVVLSASYDPGWKATVDGRPAPTEMLAPAVVGVAVGPGRHTVAFVYHGYRWYPLLFAVALGGVVIAASASLGFGDRLSRRRRLSPVRRILGGTS